MSATTAKELGRKIRLLANHMAVMDGLRPDDLYMRTGEPINTSVGSLTQTAFVSAPAWQFYVERAEQIIAFLEQDKPG